MIRVFIGSANWDIFLNPKNGSLWSVPKKEQTGALRSHFGDKRHVMRLISQGQFNGNTPTEAGLKWLSGLYSRFITPTHGKPFTLLSFATDEASA